MSGTAILNTFNKTLVSALGVQSLNSGIATILNFDAENYDTAEIFDSNLSKSRFTIPKGFNLIKLGCWITFAADATATGTRKIEVLKNGTASQANFYLKEINPLTINTVLEFNTYWYQCLPGDFFELRATQTSGGALNVTNQRFFYAEVGIY